MIDILICEGINGRNYFVRDGYLHSAVRGKIKVRESTLRKLGLVEESFLQSNKEELVRSKELAHKAICELECENIELRRKMKEKE